MSKPNAYIRRCHVCGGMTEVESKDDRSELRVERCQHCRKPFAQFQYFDDRLSPVQSDGHLRPVFAATEYEPVRGLTAHWTG